MTATDGAWTTPVGVNTIPTETVREGGLSVSDPRDLFPLHAVLLHTGNVLWFSGHTEGMHYARVSFVFDPVTGALTRIPFPGNMDLFCCHYVQLEDGRILVVGGSDPDFVAHSSRGARNIVLFEPSGSGGAWRDTGKQLLQGRWYPTAVLLGDGRVLVFSGRREYGANPAPASVADWVEVLSPPDFTPQHVTGADFALPLYPGLHLAPDGRVYYSHTNWGQQFPEPTDRALAMSGPTTGAWVDFGPRPGRPAGERDRREEGMSVLLPPAQDGKILVVSGSEARNAGDVPILQAGGGGTGSMDHIADPADARSAEIYTTGATPSWAPAPGGGATVHPRINGHLVLLPDATVLVCGGHGHYKWYRDPPTPRSNIAEIFTPSGAGAGFRAVDAMTESRMYHSTALLLPDGRVLVAGGADGNEFELQLSWPPGWPSQLTWGPSQPLNRKTHQFYRPPYLFKGTQPTITEIWRGGTRTRQVPYGSTFVVQSPQAADIRAVALMRPGAPTHHTDSEQRYVPLPFTRLGNDLSVTMLPQTQSNTAPPGFYMLWIVDDQGRPCQRAEFVQIPGPARPAAPTSSSCCLSTLMLLAAGALVGSRALVRARRSLRAG